MFDLSEAIAFRNTKDSSLDLDLVNKFINDEISILVKNAITSNKEDISLCLPYLDHTAVVNELKTRGFQVEYTTTNCVTISGWGTVYESIQEEDTSFNLEKAIQYTASSKYDADAEYNEELLFIKNFIDGYLMNLIKSDINSGESETFLNLLSCDAQTPQNKSLLKHELRERGFTVKQDGGNPWHFYISWKPAYESDEFSFWSLFGL
jgi:hypothetical protein